MNIYGEHLGMAMLNVIEPLEIIYENEGPELNIKIQDISKGSIK